MIFLNQLDDSIEILDSILNKFPNSIEPLLNKAIVLKNKNDFENSMIYIKKILNIEPNNIIANKFYNFLSKNLNNK
jgi:tetratricopeptide (TPR) repeat protein